ncbi:hypothetical protein [Leptospira terpstrae]|uniref:Uncharacterized protein n=1 Tax=Leptospira terpstrae serovar Hualin str. LT 11-33 = ATCC 700639 TaxID=1257025 RepID=N1VZ57_9LEPT|nr:hypothetical protein [Leptospira terpstrae]EMY62325.1 hypothetical protein LEP1GSC203_2232 [Leptospira terpstrae serovar Hualin str. LT 11-33 = ATCC 700639]
MIKNILKQFLILTLTILTVNCLNFRSGEFEGTPVTKNFGVSKKTLVKLNTDYQILIGGESGNANENIVQKWKNEAAKVLNESGDVLSTRSETEANYVFDIKVTESSSYFSVNVSIWFSILTAGVIPQYSKSVISLNLSVKDKSGKVLGEVKREEKRTEFGQILLLFVMPFYDPGTVVDAQRREMLSSAYAEIKEKGYLKK